MLKEYENETIQSFVYNQLFKSLDNITMGVNISSRVNKLHLLTTLKIISLHKKKLIPPLSDRPLKRRNYYIISLDFDLSDNIFTYLKTNLL